MPDERQPTHGEPTPALPVLQYDTAPRGSAVEEDGDNSVRFVLNWGASIGSIVVGLVVLALFLLVGLSATLTRPGIAMAVASAALLLACIWLGARVIRSETSRWRRQVIIAADHAGLSVTLPGQGPWTMSRRLGGESIQPVTGSRQLPKRSPPEQEIPGYQRRGRHGGT